MNSPFMIAGLFPRLFAAVYDILLLCAVLFLVTALSLVITCGEAVEQGSLWYRLLLSLTIYLFFAWFWTHGGQTLGMRAWRLQLQRNNGAPVGWGLSAIRLPLATLSWLSVVGVLWCWFDPQGRTVQDILTATQVVQHSRSIQR